MTQEEKDKILYQLNHWGKKPTMAHLLEIVFTDVTEDSLTATMPVTSKIHQPYGIMHGGASVVLAETLGSTLSYINIDNSKMIPVGTNINSNHLRPKKDGIVTGTAKFIKKGKTLHVSKIEIHDEKNKLINYTTMTNAIIPKPE